MANPQKEEGHLRVSNEVWDQVMMCDFKRTHLKIIDFVLRLSWGCGKKSAYIPKQKDFCLSGLQESHVKKELKWLERAQVLIIDWENNYFQFNKNYESWRVSIVDEYDEERLNLLIFQNLQSKDKELTNKKEKLTTSEDLLTTSEDLLTDLEVLSGETPWGSKDEEVSKDIKTYRHIKEEEANPFVFFEKNGFGIISPAHSDAMNQWIDSGDFEQPKLVMILAMREAVFNGVLKWNYVDKTLIEWSKSGIKNINDVQAHLQKRKTKITKFPNKEPSQTYEYLTPIDQLGGD